MKKYEELTFTDDFMFCKILTNNPELCHELLELILGRKVGAFTRLDKQKPIEITADGKGVRFDVYSEATSFLFIRSMNLNWVYTNTHSRIDAMSNLNLCSVMNPQKSSCAQAVTQTMYRMI